MVLTATPVKKPNPFTWDLTFNWSRHRRYLLELPAGISDLNGVTIGDRMDLIRGWKFDRSADGKIIYEGGLANLGSFL